LLVSSHCDVFFLFNGECACLFGSKKWFSTTPARARYSKALAADRLRAEKAKAFRKRRMRQRRKEGTLVLPAFWGHEIRNERQAIGFACESSLEAFCVE
jgi:hypothetical protein